MARHKAPRMQHHRLSLKALSRFSRKEQEAPYLLPRRCWELSRGSREGYSSKLFRMVPTGRLCSRVDHSHRPEGGEERPSVGASQRREEGKGKARQERCWRPLRHREKVGPATWEEPTCYICWGGGHSTFRGPGRFPAGYTPGWSVAKTRKPTLTVGFVESPTCEGDQGRGDRCGGAATVTHTRQTTSEGGGRGAGASRCHQAEQSGEGGIKEKTQEISERLPPPVTEAPSIETSLRQSELFRPIVECEELQCISSAPIEKEGAQRSRLRVPVAGKSGCRATGTGGTGRGGSHQLRAWGKKSEALQLLPAGSQAVAGSPLEGLQRDRPACKGPGFTPGWRVATIGRSLSRKADSGRDSHQARVAGREIPGNTVPGGRRDGPSPYPLGGHEALPTGPEGRGTWVVESQPKLAVGLGRGPKRQGPRKRRQRERKKGQDQRQGCKRKLVSMAAERKGKDLRERGKRRRKLTDVPADATASCTGLPREQRLREANGDSPMQPAERGGCIPPDATVIECQGADANLNCIAHPLFDPGPPVSRAGVLEKLSQCTSLAECGIWLAWGLKVKAIDLCKVVAGPTQAAERPVRSGGLFPLPVTFPDLSSVQELDLTAPRNSELAAECWLGVSSMAINVMYGCTQDGTSRTAGKVHRAAREVLLDRIKRFLNGEVPPEQPFDRVIEELNERKVNYTGEEVSQPLALTAVQIEKSLPPVGHGGSVPVERFLTGRTKYLMENPSECLLPENEWGDANLQARVHIKKGEELGVFELLRERGIIKWVPASTAFQSSRGAILNGLFGVVKPGRFTSTGCPILRVIMNLIPANSVLSIIRGDIAALPSASAWIPIVLSEGNELFMSQGDMSSAFYLFSIPDVWLPYMVFNYLVPGEKIGLTAGTFFRPACVVLPMGWNSSVGVMQQLSREVLLRHGLPRNLELRKGHPLPTWFSEVLEKTPASKAWWQVYLDNFMSGEVSRGPEHNLNAWLGELAMEGWSSAGILTAQDKQVVDSPSVVELGVRLDGASGLLGASPARVLKTIWASVHFLRRRWWDKKLAQIILGRWVFILQFRRAAMSCLSRSWESVEAICPRPAQIELVHHEVLQLVCMAPLLQTDMRAGYDEEITCSDASETGGAAAISRGLTWSGKSLVSFLSDQRLQPIAKPILLISVFNGIGGCFRIYDILGVAVEARISIDVSKPANRVTRCTWPNTLELLDITQIKREDVQEWANAHPRVAEVHLMAGFPCVHLSAVRAYRQNLEGEGSRLFWDLLTLIGWIEEIFGSFCKFKYCVENVASMDEAARREISGWLDIVPVKLCPSDCMPFSRPRFAWCSVELYEMEGLSLFTEKEYVRAFAEGPEVPVSSWIRPGWKWEAAQDGVKFPTFMKSIPRLQPPPMPAGLHRASADTVQRWREDEYRFPPYQYARQFMLSHPDHPLRTLDSSERELLLGFGPGHTKTCMPASESKKSAKKFEDTRKSLCGDSFAIVSFAIIASQMCAELLPRMSPSRIVSRLGLAPGSSAHPDVAVPLTRWLNYGGSGEVHEGGSLALVKQLGLTVNHTGSDVRITTGQLMGGKTQAHGSVGAFWWQWKQLFKVRWIQPNHINFLEMRMILNTLLWKSRNPKKVGRRWLHLEDSMVCLYILSKGRTSSHLLQPLAKKIGAIQMGLGCTVLHGHVASEENPTDAASRD